MVKLLQISAFLTAVAFTTAHAICSTNWALSAMCDTECPFSGTCEDDKCRYCCIVRECPDFFKDICAVDSNAIYKGENHCTAGNEISACNPSCVASASFSRCFEEFEDCICGITQGCSCTNCQGSVFQYWAEHHNESSCSDIFLRWKDGVPEGMSVDESDGMKMLNCISMTLRSASLETDSPFTKID